MVSRLKAKCGGIFAAALTSMMVLLSASASGGLCFGERSCAGGFPSLNEIEEPAEDLVVKTKSPMKAVIRSGLVPGWGQLYNEQYLKSGLVFVIEGLLIGAVVVEHRRADDALQESKNISKSDAQREAAWLRYSRRIDKRNTYLWYWAGAKFLSMVDAYVDAHLYRFEEGPFAVHIEVRPEAGGGVGVAMSYAMW